jgi:hypothetical protein
MSQDESGIDGRWDEFLRWAVTEGGNGDASSLGGDDRRGMFGARFLQPKLGGGSTVYLPTVLKNYTPPLFFDDFSDPGSGWFIGDDGNISRSYQNGEYEILLRNEAWWAGNTAPISNDISRYSVEANIRLHTGSTSSYGLIFDRVDWDHFYLFLVHPGSRSYSLWSIDSGWAPLVPWTSSSFINSGSAINHLKVQRDGSQVTMYVNGRLMTTANDATHVGTFREVGVYAESVGEAPVAVRFDNFRVLRLAN